MRPSGLRPCDTVVGTLVEAWGGSLVHVVEVVEQCAGHGILHLPGAADGDVDPAVLAVARATCQRTIAVNQAVYLIIKAHWVASESGGTAHVVHTRERHPVVG